MTANSDNGGPNIHQVNEFLVKLERVGLTSALIQQIIEREDNLVKPVVDLIRGTTKAADAADIMGKYFVDAYDLYGIIARDILHIEKPLVQEVYPFHMVPYSERTLRLARREFVLIPYFGGITLAQLQPIANFHYNNPKFDPKFDLVSNTDIPGPVWKLISTIIYIC